MFQVEDDQRTETEPIETIHLYVVREGQKRPSIAPVIISLLVLILLFVIGILIPYQQPKEHKVIRVPAILLPLKTFTTSIIVVPTGIKTYLSTTAHGLLTITNGSILSEDLPKGMIFTGKDGVEVITDQAVYVPAGSATGLGYATVTAHTVTPGAKGNISALDINAVEGTSLFIRNLQSFSGGADSYSVKFITSQDRENALVKARSRLLPQSLSGLLESPCKETVTGEKMLSVRWTCQFVSYNVPDLPAVKVLHAKVSGKTILLEVVYVPRPKLFPGK
jgi:hypothetical protein